MAMARRKNPGREKMFSDLCEGMRDQNLGLVRDTCAKLTSDELDQGYFTHGRTPLIFASFCGYTLMVDCLLSSGCNPCLADTRGRTALHEASFWGYGGIVLMLRRAGASSHKKDNHGVTPLDEAKARGHTFVHLLETPLGFPTLYFIACKYVALYYLDSTTLPPATREFLKINFGYIR